MSTIVTVIIIWLSVANGTLLTHFIIGRTTLRARIAMGTVVGLALLAWVGFLSALVFGLNRISIGVAVAVLLFGVVVLKRIVGFERILTGEFNARLTTIGVIYYTAWTALLIWLFSRVVMLYPDGLHTAPANNFGDLPFHLSVITSFAYGENLPPGNPIFAGMKFTYPFLIDFLTAFFIRCGADWRAAFFVSNLPLALALICLIEQLTLSLFRNSLAARLAPVIFFFNGGLGFINFFQDFGERSGGLLLFLAHLPKAYTMNNELQLASGNVPLRWGNVFTTLLLPQRSMLFGLPIVALIILFWWMAVEERERERGTRSEESPLVPLSPCLLASSTHSPRRYFLAAGILAGLLPMLHAHGFLSVMIASVPLALLFFSREWLAFFIPAGLLALPQALYLSGTPVKIKLAEKLFHWEAGESNPLVFWLVNAGVMIALVLAALLIKRFTTAVQARFYLPFILWFLAPNILLFAPWPWDNIKIFVYWSLISAPFVAGVLALLFTQRLIALRSLALTLLAALTLTGAIDVIRALSPAENLGLFSQEEMEVAALLRAQTPPNAVVLHAPIHNSVVAPSGRRSVMGYPGHLWTHGIEYAQREADVKAIYGGGVEAVKKLSELSVDYVIVGPRERSELAADDRVFEKFYPVIIDHTGYRVYTIKGMFNR